MKVKKSLTLELNEQEAMDLRALLYIAKDNLDTDNEGAELLKAFAENLLVAAYL